MQAATPSTILIVDDEPTGRETLEALLVAHGYNLAFAHDGPRALEQAAALVPDLVLLDVMMPGMDGFEVCQRLRDDAQLSEIPIIMVTALDDHDSRVKGIEAGADDFISKPFNRTELRARVRTITRLNRYRRLLAERARFEWVVDQAEDGFLIVDEQDTILYRNARAQIYFNQPTAEPPSSETFLSLARAYYQCEPSESWRAWPTLPDASSAPPSRYLVRPETLTSHPLWLGVDCFDMPAGAKPGRLIRLRDVTAQMTRQRQTWTFHALISHKLSTPLSSLLNSLHILSTDPATLSPDDMKEFTAIALKGAQRLRQQVQEIRAYLKTPGLAQPGDECSSTMLVQMVEQIATELELPEVHISGAKQVGEVHAVLSRNAIELIVRQVLENAHKFHPTRAPAVEITLSLAQEGNTSYLTIQVHDDGITLSPEQLGQAWVPYYQGEKDFSGEVPGMGLGLAMVATLLWTVGGRYHIANRSSGPGVVVELAIPLVVW
jgi:DNA-binding response OmpR family regulator